MNRDIITYSTDFKIKHCITPGCLGQDGRCQCWEKKKKTKQTLTSANGLLRMKDIMVIKFLKDRYRDITLLQYNEHNDSITFCTKWYNYPSQDG